LKGGNGEADARSGTPARRILGQSLRATILSASSGKERCNAFTSHPVRSHPYIAFLVLSD
jgi:hypothetical protein